MRLIESSLVEVSAEEYMEALGSQEMVINLSFDNGMTASVALSKDRVFVEMLSPVHKFFVGPLKDIDFEKRVKRQAEEVKKVLKKEGRLPFS